jgi:hypothetical protein
LGNKKLGDLLKLANHLDIKPLIDVYLDEISRRIFPTVYNELKKGLPTLPNLPIPKNRLKEIPIPLKELWENISSKPELVKLKTLLDSFQASEVLFNIPQTLPRLLMYTYLRFVGVPSFTIEEYLAYFGQPSSLPDPDGDSGITGIDMRSKGLTSLKGVDKIRDKNTQYLNLYENSILDSDLDPDFPFHPFKSFGNLTELNLTGNQLTSLPVGVFHGLGNLTELNLTGNQLTSLPEGIFQGLGNLTMLHLSENQLTSLPEGIFNRLGNLRELYLDDNLITSLPVSILQGLENLMDLNLDFNQLTSLPVGIFKGLGNLTELRLTRNQLTSLPVGIFKGLGNLIELYLDDNQIASLPVGIFRGLKNLAMLLLSGNQIPGTKEDFRALHHLPIDVSISFDPQKV